MSRLEELAGFLESVLGLPRVPTKRRLREPSKKQAKPLNLVVRQSVHRIEKQCPNARLREGASIALTEQAIDDRV